MNLEQAISLVYDKLKGWLHAIVLMLPNMAAAIAVVVVFTFFSRLVGRALRNVLRRVWKTQDVLNVLISKTAAAGVVLTGILTALSILDLDKPVTSLLAGVGVIGIALGFAFQDIASNFMSGILISLQHPCEVGDLIKTGSYVGKVERIALRSTTIRTFQGPLVIIPNKDILQGPLTNFTRSGHRRVEIRVHVARDADVDQVKETVALAVSSMDGLQAGREVEVYFEEIDDSSTQLVVWLWVDYVEERDYVAARSEAIVRIKKALSLSGLRLSSPGPRDHDRKEPGERDKLTG